MTASISTFRERLQRYSIDPCRLAAASAAARPVKPTASAPPGPSHDVAIGFTSSASPGKKYTDGLYLADQQASRPAAGTGLSGWVYSTPFGPMMITRTSMMVRMP